MSCTCSARLCDRCGYPLGPAWITDDRVDPLLGESRRELCFPCHDREQAGPWKPTVGVIRKPKARKKK